MRSLARSPAWMSTPASAYEMGPRLICVTGRAGFCSGGFGAGDFCAGAAAFGLGADLGAGLRAGLGCGFFVLFALAATLGTGSVLLCKLVTLFCFGLQRKTGGRLILTGFSGGTAVN